MIIAATLAIGVSVFFLWICLKRPAKTITYAFQVYDNLGKYIYTKRVNAENEQEACSKIEKYIPKDYTYQIVFREL